MTSSIPFSPGRSLVLALLLAVSLAGCGPGSEAGTAKPEAAGGSAPAVEVLADGGFEAGTPGQAPPAPWVTNDMGNVVAPLEEAPADPRVGFPSEGARWLRLDAGHHGPSTEEDYLDTASQVRQRFRCGDAGFVLALDAAFVTYEIPGAKGSNDFLAVDVLQGARRATLLKLDNRSAEFPFRSHGDRPATARETVALDLREAFEGIDGQTPFELVLSIANVNDEGMDSKGYVDAVRLQEKVPLRPFDTRVVRGEDGKWRLRSTSAAHAGMTVRHYVTRTPSDPTGSGPFFGLAFDHEVLAQQAVKPGTAPFSVTLDEAGRYESEPLALPAGTRIDYIGMVMDGATVVARSHARTIVLE